MKKLLFIILAALPMLMSAAVVTPLHLTDVQVLRSEDSLSFRLRLNPKKYHLSTNAQWRITPVLRSADGKHVATLAPIVITGKNAYYYALRQDNTKESGVVRSGSRRVSEYFKSVKWEKWMERSRLSLVTEKVSRCGNNPCVLPEHDTVPVAELYYAPMRYEPQFEYVVPVRDDVKQRTLSGRAYVNFMVNKTDIVPTYMNNTVELRKILNSIDSVKFNRDATVDTIRLTGYASPEGPYANNVRLAQGRTEAVKRYVMNLYDFPSRVYFTNSVPEDWQGLREYIAASAISEKERMLYFIDDPYIPVETRNDIFAQMFPEQYAYLLKNEYPWLRHTDYYIHYIVKQYTTVEEILEAMRVNPRNLSLNEFFRAANYYPQGSRDFCDVIERAVSYFPNDPTANLNAAIAAMSEGEYTRASRYLDKAGASAEAIYSRGVLLAIKGEWQKAKSMFELAADMDLPAASKALAEVNAILDTRHQIEYLCK